MSSTNPATIDAAHRDADAVLSLARDLVRIPSRGGIDSYTPIVQRLRTWLAEHNLPSEIVVDVGGNVVAVTCEIRGDHPGPRYVLDACLDTAPFGDEQRWRFPPTSATVEDGWLHGRGSADSKTGISIFCHIAARLARQRASMHGSVMLLFDLDEHTGGFAGAKTFFESGSPGPVAGVLIGYPGLQHLVIGGRGVHRLKLHVHGISSHSGGRASTPNAIVKAADVIRALADVDLSGTGDENFPMGAKFTVTAVTAGEGFSVTPDLCTLNVDIRTTATFTAADADHLLRVQVARIDDRWPHTPPSLVQHVTTWPAYALDDLSPLRSTVTAAAASLGLPLACKVAGPSNIGNYLAGRGVPATAGFGVDYVGLHATDERIRIASIPLVQSTYHSAVLDLVSAPAHQDN